MEVKYARHYEYYDGQLTLNKKYEALPFLLGLGKDWVLLVNDENEKVYYKIDNFDIVEEEYNG